MSSILLVPHCTAKRFITRMTAILLYSSSWILLDINECSRNPCKNGATCVNLKGSYRCNCKTGYTGITCERGKRIFDLLNAAAPHRTSNRFVTNLIMIAMIFYYSCLFILDINECSKRPCKNRGTCINLKGSYRCTCKTGYTGNNCEIGKHVTNFSNSAAPSLHL